MERIDILEHIQKLLTDHPHPSITDVSSCSDHDRIDIIVECNIDEGDGEEKWILTFGSNQFEPLSTEE